MNETGVNKDSVKLRLTEYDKIRMGLKAKPRGPLTVKVVYPVWVSAGAMYYQTEMIAQSELGEWMAKHKGLEVMGAKNGI